MTHLSPYESQDIDIHAVLAAQAEADRRACKRDAIIAACLSVVVIAAALIWMPGCIGQHPVGHGKRVTIIGQG